MEEFEVLIHGLKCLMIAGKVPKARFLAEAIVRMRKFCWGAWRGFHALAEE